MGLSEHWHGPLCTVTETGPQGLRGRVVILLEERHAQIGELETTREDPALAVRLVQRALKVAAQHRDRYIFTTRHPRLVSAALARGAEVTCYVVEGPLERTWEASSKE